MDELLSLDLDIVDTSHRQLERETSSEFTRKTTEIALHGPASNGAESEPNALVGRGEDVIYDADHHETLDRTGLPEGITGTYTLRSFSAHLEDLDLFPSDTPSRPDFAEYRQWAFESAALDLALQQAGTSLGEVIGRERSPLRFVASTRLGEPPTTERVEAFRAIDADLEYKLDPTPAWSTELIEDLASMDVVRILDLKGQYEGTDVDVPGDPARYRQLVEAFPDAVLEDPEVREATRPVLEAEDVRSRLSWDAIIHGVADVEALPWEPEWLNIKPSRFGSIESLLETIAHCEREGITCYGGGQFELGVGRGQIQLLASLYYPAAPNDVAPGAYNDPEIGADLPSSPLEPPAASPGFRWT